MRVVTVVNALGQRLDGILAHHRWVASRADRHQDEEFERELRELRATLATYREILIAHGFLQPGADFRRQ